MSNDMIHTAEDLRNALADWDMRAIASGIRADYEAHNRTEAVDKFIAELEDFRDRYVQEDVVPRIAPELREELVVQGAFRVAREARSFERPFPRRDRERDWECLDPDEYFGDAWTPERAWRWLRERFPQEEFPEEEAPQGDVMNLLTILERAEGNAEG